MAYNHFDYVPSSVTNDRSGFKFQKAVSKAGQIGWLYPMCAPVVMLPGSSLTLDVAMEVRSQPLIAPLQDSLELDLFAFNVPNRIVWEHWKQFLGATDDVVFDRLQDYAIPSFRYGNGDWEGTPLNDEGESFASVLNYAWNQTLACHMELPYPIQSLAEVHPNPEYVNISALPFRGYNFIYNEFFIPEYLDQRILFSKTDDGSSGDNMGIKAVASGWNRFNGVNCPGPHSIDDSNTTSIGGCVMPVYRAHRSLYTSCLPKPSLETLNLLGTVENAPVVGGPSLHSVGTDGIVFQNDLAELTGTILGIGGNGSVAYGSLGGLSLNDYITKTNLITKLSDAILTVNNYRETILLQNYYDALNRSGSRYDEIIRNLFHVQTSMAVIDVPELIVHKRFTIYRKDVIATAQTNNGSDTVKPLGSQSAYIDTVIRDSFFTKSTTEHGYIHMLMCVRPTLIRQTSGIEPHWTVLDKLGLFYEQFQGMGDVPRFKKEIAFSFDGTDDQNAVLGYQEYSGEYKWQRNSSCGWMDPHTPNPIRGYNINDEFQSTQDVSLNNYWLSCATEEVSFANCLVVPDPSLAPQLIFDIRLNGTIYHPMKVYNIPGQGDLL